LGFFEEPIEEKDESSHKASHGHLPKIMAYVIFTGFSENTKHLITWYCGILYYMGRIT